MWIPIERWFLADEQRRGSPLNYAGKKRPDARPTSPTDLVQMT